MPNAWNAGPDELPYDHERTPKRREPDPKPMYRCGLLDKDSKPCRRALAHQGPCDHRGPFHGRNV